MTKYLLKALCYVFLSYQLGFCGAVVLDREYDLGRAYEDGVITWSYATMLVIEKNAKRILPEEGFKQVKEVQQKQPLFLSIKIEEPVNKEVSQKEEKETPSCNKEVVVYFNFNQSKLPEKQRQLLVEEVRSLKNKCSLTAVVYGYACPIGSEKYNLKLSKLRAQTVAEILKKEGVTVTEIKGLGEVNDKDNVFCLNRKVVIKLQAKE